VRQKTFTLIQKELQRVAVKPRPHCGAHPLCGLQRSSSLGKTRGAGRLVAQLRNSPPSASRCRLGVAPQAPPAHSSPASPALELGGEDFAASHLEKPRAGGDAAAFEPVVRASHRVGRLRPRQHFNLQRLLHRFGVLLAFYSDRSSIFVRNHRWLLGLQIATQPRRFSFDGAKAQFLPSAWWARLALLRRHAPPAFQLQGNNFTLPKHNILQAQDEILPYRFEKSLRGYLGKII
jgi:hypothetical protein